MIIVTHIFVLKEIITVTGTNLNNKRNEKPIFKNNPPFKLCITKIYNTFVDNAEDLDIVMLMYKFLEYIESYSMTSESLWSY